MAGMMVSTDFRRDANVPSTSKTKRRRVRRLVKRAKRALRAREKALLLKGELEKLDTLWPLVSDDIDGTIR